MMAKADRDEAERLNSKNSVEEYIYEIRGKICDELEDFMLEGDREKFSRELTDAEDWLYEDGEFADKKTYTEKLATLRATGEAVRRGGESSRRGQRQSTSLGSACSSPRRPSTRSRLAMRSSTTSTPPRWRRCKKQSQRSRTGSAGCAQMSPNWTRPQTPLCWPPSSTRRRSRSGTWPATYSTSPSQRWSPLPHLQQSLQRRKGWRRRSREAAVSRNQPVKKLHSRSRQRWTWTKKLDQIYKHFMRSLFV